MGSNRLWVHGEISSYLRPLLGKSGTVHHHRDLKTRFLRTAQRQYRNMRRIPTVWKLAYFGDLGFSPDRDGTHQRTHINNDWQPRRLSQKNELPHLCKVVFTMAFEHTVSFSPRVEVMPALHISNYSDDEIQSTWFDQHDLKRIRKDINRLVALMERDQCPHEDVESIRGIECWTKRGYRQKRQNKITARDTVLSEQEMQWYDGIIDTARLSMVYQNASTECHIAARMAGESDERVARGLDAWVEPKQPEKPIHTFNPRSLSSPRKQHRNRWTSILFTRNTDVANLSKVPSKLQRHCC